MAAGVRFLCWAWLGLAFLAGTGKACAQGETQDRILAVQAVGPGKAEASVQPMSGAGKDLALGRKNLDENHARLAVQYLAQAAKTVDREGPSIVQFEAFYYYGKALGMAGEHNDALTYHFKAQRVAEALKSDGRLAETLAAVGEDLIQLKDYSQAELHLRKASEIFLDLGDQVRAGQTLTEVGECYLAGGQDSRAAEVFRKALALFETENYLPGQVKAHERLARSLTEQRYFSQAVNELQKTLRLADSAHMSEEKTAAYLDLSDCYSDADEGAKALFYGNIGLGLAQRYHQLNLQERANLLLSQQYAALKDHSKALRHYKSYVDLRDRIANDVRSKQLAEMRLRYENEKIGKEIAVLTREKKIRELDLTRQRILLWVGVGMIALLGLLAAVLHRKNLAVRHANDNLHVKNLKIEQQRDQIEVQKAGLKDALGQLESSITYAKRIQDSILSASDPLETNFSDPLIYFRPKAIVSGDFYWVSHQDQETVIVVADCTGHGVPGAFMSLIGHSTLEKVLGSVPDLDPSRILAAVDEEIGRTLDAREGIEMSVCVINRISKSVRFSGARRDALIVCQDKVETLPGSRRSVGGVYARKAPVAWQFRTVTMQLPKGCMIYFFSDGYTDQHSEDGHKFGLPQLRTLLQNMQGQKSDEQMRKLDEAMLTFKGAAEQTDDILIVGLRIG